MKIKYTTYSISKKNNLILRWADGQNVISTSLTDSMIKLHVYCILVKQRNSKRVTQQQNRNYHVWEKLLGPHFFARSGTQTNVFVRFDLWLCSFYIKLRLKMNTLKNKIYLIPRRGSSGLLTDKTCFWKDFGCACSQNTLKMYKLFFVPVLVRETTEHSSLVFRELLLHVT